MARALNSLAFKDETTSFSLRTPKRSAEKVAKAKEAFPYYAGYSESFAEDALRLLAPPGALVLDPWNGAGTTTAVASLGGWDSVSFDLNPVMVVVAKARLATDADIREANSKLNRFLREFRSNSSDNDDPLANWIGAQGAGILRYVINRALGIRNSKHHATLKTISERVSTAETWRCLIILSAFRVTKAQYKSTSSNPTWTKAPKGNSEISLSFEQWESELKLELIKLAKIANARNRIESVNVSTEIKCASSVSLPLANASIDFVLTSPPYCTRIDYAVATLLELAVLGLNKSTVDLGLRRHLLGSTANSCTTPDEPNTAMGSLCLDFLEKVRKHPSHGSKTYYYKNFFQYFFSLHQSICEISRVLKPGGTICAVLQGSHYKEHPIDLPEIFVEMAQANNLKLIKSLSFQASQYFVHININSLRYRGKKPMTEQVLVLKKN